MFKLVRSASFALCMCLSLSTNTIFGELANFGPNSKIISVNFTPGQMYGVEVIFPLRSYNNWYGFVSPSFVSNVYGTRGFACGLGLQYFVPIQNFDFYIGLGMEPAVLRGRYAPSRATFSTIGGIGKFGAYIAISEHLYLHPGIDYIFGGCISRFMGGLGIGLRF